MYSRFLCLALLLRHTSRARIHNSPKSKEIKHYQTVHRLIKPLFTYCTLRQLTTHYVKQTPCYGGANDSNKLGSRESRPNRGAPVVLTLLSTLWRGNRSGCRKCSDCFDKRIWISNYLIFCALWLWQTFWCGICFLLVSSVFVFIILVFF